MTPYATLRSTTYAEMQESQTQEQWSEHSTWNSSGENFF